MQEESVNNADKTLQIDNLKDTSVVKDSKTLVINITLQGIPKKTNSDDKKDIKQMKKFEESAKEITKPTAKRKIKALFGESSDSDMEPEDIKKCKLSRDKVTSNKSSYDNKNEKLKSKNSKKNHRHKKSTHSDTEIEKNTHKTVTTKDNAAENTLILDSHNVSNETENTDDTPIEMERSEEDALKNYNSNASSELIINQNTTATINFVDDKSFNKAQQLSLEADKVLQELKQFSEIKPEPVIEETISIKDKTLDSKSSVLISKSPNGPKEKEKAKPINIPDKQKEPNLSKKEHTTHKNKIKHVSKGKESKSREKKAEKVDVASLVVKLLMPYYKKKKISNRDLFKITARHIVHQLLAIQVTGKNIWNIFLSTIYLRPSWRRDKRAVVNEMALGSIPS